MMRGMVFGGRCGALPLGLATSAVLSIGCFSDPNPVIEDDTDAPASTGASTAHPGTSASSLDGTPGTSEADTSSVSASASTGDPPPADSSGPPDDTGSMGDESGTTGEPEVCMGGPFDFTWAEVDALDVAANPQDLAGGFLDGDAHIDLAVAGSDDHIVQIWRGLGDGAFEHLEDQNVAGSPNRVKLAAIGDVTVDLFVRFYDAIQAQDRLVRRRGNGAGSFQFQDEIGPVGGFALGLLDADDRLDVVAATPFGVDPPRIDGYTAAVDESYAQPFTLADAGGIPYLADYEGDGDDDLFVRTQGQQLLLYQNQDGAPNELAPIALPAQPTGAIGFGDIDHDTQLDFVTGSFGGGNTVVNVYLGNAKGQFGSTPYAISNYTTEVAIIDADADGVRDVILAAPDGTITFLRGNGGGTLAAEQITGVPGCSNARGLVISDMNGDCVPDIALACNGITSEVRVLVSSH